MMNSVSESFDAHADAYDALRHRLVPSYDAVYGTAVAALGLIPRSPRRVLDLGAGTGRLSRHILEAHPDAQITLLDGAAGMLDQARAVMGERHAYVQADLTDPLPAGGPWCAVVSALAIHHLEDDAKRDLFARVLDALAPRGLFINAEVVAGPTPALEDLYARWHESRARALGATDEDWDGAVDRMRHDRCATVEDQLAWLREAGFADVDCLFKDHRFAVIVARRPAED
jgi:tRNA (cmo5U34)-methyltransferase